MRAARGCANLGAEEYSMTAIIAWVMGVFMTTAPASARPVAPVASPAEPEITVPLCCNASHCWVKPRSGC
jgi:hypothetical protein